MAGAVCYRGNFRAWEEGYIFEFQKAVNSERKFSFAKTFFRFLEINFWNNRLKNLT